MPPRPGRQLKRLLELEVHLRAEVDQLFRLAEQADRHELPEGLNVADEIALRQERLARLAEAEQVLQARAQERQAANRPNTKPRYASGRPKPNAPAVSRAGGHRHRLRPSRKTRTSTISPILSRAS